MAVVFSVLSACGYAVASVLQQGAAHEVPAEYSMRIGLLTRLVRRPLWLAGVAADIGAFLLEAVALGLGSVSLVQPILVVGLPLALGLAAVVSHQHLGSREWTATGALCLSLLLFIAVNHPQAGDDFAPIRRWLVVVIIVAGGMAICVAAAMARPAARATLLAAATGLIYCITAGLTKSVAALVSNDVFSIFRHWETYAMLGVGLLSMLLAQSSFQAGHLRQSLPMLTLVPPVAGVLAGAYLFGEDLHVTPFAAVADVFAVLLAAWSVFTLSRSPLAESAYGTA
jgi:hypothetical protein